MLTNICRTLEDNPDDVTVFINEIVPQKIDRAEPPFADKSDSCFNVLKFFSLTSRELFDARQRTLRLLAIKPAPIPRRRASAQPRGRHGPSRAMEAEAEEALDLFMAGRLGRTDVLREMVRTGGTQSLHQRDTAGHSVAHWVALEGHAETMQFLVTVGGPFDTTSRHELGQKPLHWACANGCVAVIDVLLQADSDINVRDTAGCTPLIVACQYEQTTAAAFLMARGAQLQECDKEGDNALHWAAFRGRPDLIRLLVYSGFNPHQRDNFGQSALHLACSSGNLCAVRDLVRIDKVNHELEDVKGRTPLALAIARRHDDVIDFLRREKGKAGGSLWAVLDVRSMVFGPPGRKRQAQLGFVLITMLLLYPAFLIKVFPITWASCSDLTWLFFALNVLAWISFAKCSFADPGFLPQFQAEYDLQMRRIGCSDRPPDLSQLCHTCRAVKPLRAKHCRVCDRCVKHMDHHCPYIYNCVGYNNRGWFFCFSYIVLFIAMLSFYFLYLTLSAGLDLFLIILIPIGAFGFSVVGLVSCCLWLSVIQNITTNEMTNRKRYAYLKNSRGLFRNPFDRGCVTNVLEYFHLKPPREFREEQVPLIL